jgi:hypothetical protein
MSCWDTYGLPTLREFEQKRASTMTELSHVNSIIESMQAKHLELKGQLSVLKALDKTIGNQTITQGPVYATAGQPSQPGMAQFHSMHPVSGQGQQGNAPY